MLEGSGQEHELLAHIGASRSRTIDETFRAQLQGFLGFQTVRLDGQDVLTQSGPSPRLGNVDSTPAPHFGLMSAETTVLPESMLSGRPPEAIPAHSFLVEASPTVIVKRSPADVQGFQPIPETPLGQQLAQKSVTVGPPSKTTTTSAAAAASSFVLDTQHRILDRQSKFDSKELRLLKYQSVTFPDNKGPEMDDAYSDSSSSTSYYAPPPLVTSTAEYGVPGTGTDRIILDQGPHPSQSSQDGAHQILKPQSTQEAYKHAAKDLAAVIDLTETVFDIRGPPQTLPCANAVSPILPTQAFSRSQRSAQPPQNSSPSVSGPVDDSAKDNAGFSRHTERSSPRAPGPANESSREDAAISQPTEPSGQAPSRTNASKPAEPCAWPPGGNKFVSPNNQPKTGEGFTTHRTPILENVLSMKFGEEGTLSDRYNGVVVGAEPATHDRGCWVFRVPSAPAPYAWTEKQRDIFFRKMAGAVGSGILGPVSLEQLSAHKMAKLDYGQAPGGEAWHSGAANDDWCRVFCWGEVYKEIWCVMLKASDGGILGLPSGMRWVVGNGDCRVIVPGDN